jgi:hypothetical protein
MMTERRAVDIYLMCICSVTEFIYDGVGTAPLFCVCLAYDKMQRWKVELHVEISVMLRSATLATTRALTADRNTYGVANAQSL